jgi:hypothetical protein
MMYLYDIEFGHFKKQLVNFYYYVTFSVMMYKYDHIKCTLASSSRLVHTSKVQHIEVMDK